MTDSSMNFGPAWIRNLRPEGTTVSSGGGTSGGTRYQLAEYRYGREEMLALFDKMVKAPPSLTTFKTLYSELALVPLALLPNTEEEQRSWQTRPAGGASRGRGGSLERGGRISRGRGGYQAYGRAASAYDSGWGNGEQPDWSPRKEFSTRSSVSDNWRRVRNSNDDDDGWRNMTSTRPSHEKWGRSSSWRGEGDSEERNGPPERGGRSNWHENNRGGPLKRSWDNDDNLPEWATENPTEGGGTFDERGAFHGSDDEQDTKKNKRDMLQKSTSQQHIHSKISHSDLSTSKSATSLVKSEESDKFSEEPDDKSMTEYIAKLKESSSPEKTKSKSTGQKVDNKDEKNEKLTDEVKAQAMEKISSSNGPPQDSTLQPIDKVDEDFDRLQEDLVLKLVVDEESPAVAQSGSYDVPSVQPPPNLVPTSQDKWYYQDPQGTRQGPFANVEMAEWYKAGYFSNQLNVMRECDERYFLLGELINVCGSENPFLSNVRFPVMKSEPAKLPDDMLPYQYLSQLAFKQQVSLRNLAEPWSALTLQQQELAAQRLLLQQQQIPPDLQFIQQAAPANPLMYMINQMQQSNKLPGSVLVDKPTSSVPNQIDPLLMQMGNMHSLQNRIQTPNLHNHLPGAVPTNLSTSLPPDGLGGTLPGLQTPPIATTGISSISGLPGNLPTSLNVPRPTSHNIDQVPPGQDNDPLTNFLKQFQQQRQPPLDSLWQKQSQFNVPPAVNPTTQWSQQSEASLSMWDLQTSTPDPPSASIEKTLQDKEKEPQPKEELSQKEMKKRKEQEEKQAKKEAEERRKIEQKKQDAEKKSVEDKKKKEDEKIRKELEKAKKEAEEKRLRELEEKRRLKEQRKAEEEARKKCEELRKLKEEKNRREMKEREDKKQAEFRLAQTQAARGISKTAPWSQSNFASGVNLTDIQKAEKERRAQETALQLQKQQQLQEQQQQIEKAGGLQLSWAKKPLEPRKVKSFAEIQAEEQERMAKLSQEAKLAAQLKEKEIPVSNSGNIWNGQSLSWANASSTSQWSSSSAGGFWDEVPSKSSDKPSTVSKSNSTSAMTTTKQQQQKQSKNKSKKEESPKSVNNNNNNQTKDEFTDWCYKTLSSISADVDIPTFVTFLRDIESAYDVRDYCKEYLGESPATQQFASNFLEKRRQCKPKNNAHKDDMCSPAPAITPSSQHSTEFQEVKGKNKKNKKSKMLKVDSRILGFNVTSAPDRINVGDRDYGDNF